MFQKSLTFDDFLLVPQYSDIESRSEVDISSQLDSKLKLDTPIISSPMDTVTEHVMASTMSRKGGLGVIHRYNSIPEQVAQVNEANCGFDTIGAAVGVKDDFIERTQELVKAGAKVICVDVAHGDHVSVKKALESLEKLPERSKFHLMAGNVATGAGYMRLAQWGADSVRVGIGGGSICSTRINTGHGLPNMSALFDCATARKSPDCGSNRPSIIIDGGIKTAGDMVKALAAGADFVMCGSLLAGTDESPGNLIQNPNGSLVKEYRGMASREAQMNWRGKSSSPEGIATFVNYKGSVNDILDDLIGNIKSGLSYSGARSLRQLREKAQFVLQSSAGMNESFTHILHRNAK
jgi:IMP dehydrogenase